MKNYGSLQAAGNKARDLIPQSQAGLLDGPQENGDSKAPADSLELRQLLRALVSARDGDFTVRLPSDLTGIEGKIADVFNEIMHTNQRMAEELERLSRVVGKEGKLSNRASFDAHGGAWSEMQNSVNTLVSDLAWPVAEITRSVDAVAKGDLTRELGLEVEGRPLKGEFLRSAKIVNTMIGQLNLFTSEVTRVAREVGSEGKLGGQAQVKKASGVWKDLTESVNFMASNLTAQVRNIAEVTTAVARGDLSRKITLDVKGEILELKNTINTMVDQFDSFASEVTRVAREVGTEGKLGGQAEVPGVAGTWKDLTDNVNSMASNLTAQVRNLADVTIAVVTVFVELARQTQIIKKQADDLAAHNRRQGEQLEVIQKLNGDLKDANTELEAFSYTVSHDLRAPLRSITGYVNILLEDYGPQMDEAGRGHLLALDRAAKRMDALTRDLLAYGRVARETVALNRVSLRPLLEAIIALHSVGTRHPAKIDIAPELQDVWGHHFLLEQSLNNLIDNATKFVSPGKTPEIQIRTEPRDGWVRLWIEDNGIGIDAGYHHRIFTMFERVGDLHKYDGTGIGLAIVRRAVQRMGGECGVESAAGVGSRFWVDLPSVPNAQQTKTPAWK